MTAFVASMTFLSPFPLPRATVAWVDKELVRLRPEAATFLQ